MPALQPLAVTARTVSILLTSANTCFRLNAPVSWRLEGGNGFVVEKGVTETAGIFVENLEPNNAYRFISDFGDLEIKTPDCAGLIDACDYGVDVSNDDNSDAFASAIAAVPAGGTLRVPSGRFLTRPIFLKAQMNLLLQDGAEIAAVSDRDGWPILPEWDENEKVIGTWEGLPDASFAAVVTAINCDGVTVSGKGTIDGGGDRGDWWSWPKERREGARRPRTLHVAHSDDVILSGITVRNSPSWTVHPFMSNRLKAVSLHIENPPDSPNTDGLNPESCEDVEIAAVTFSVGDDCIAIKAGKRSPDEARHLAPTKHVRIHHCYMERGHGAVVIGSEMSGDVTDIAIENCEFLGTDRGLRIKTRRGRGGRVERISISDSVMTDVPTPLAINSFYFCDPDGKSPEVQSREYKGVDETTPVISDISIRNVKATSVSLAGAALLGLPESPIQNVRLKNYQISFKPDAEPDVPLMALNVPAIRHKSVFSEFADVDGAPIIIDQDRDPAPC